MTIPISVLTGFLGSGKTTLLNHALRGPWLSNALVVVNELGAIPLDHLLVREVREDVLLLDSGCVCCSIRSDLVDTLLAEADKHAAGRFHRVFVETTGLADPTPIVATLVRHAELGQHYHLDAIITAVDGEHAISTLERHDEARKQVLLADDLVITKVDKVDADTLQATKDATKALNARARTFLSEQGKLDWKPILEWTPSTVAARLDVTPTESPHGRSTVRSFCARADSEVDFNSFALWLSMVSQLHGENLLRVKGLLRVKDEEGPIVVHAVQHVVYPAYTMPCWPSEDTTSRVMVITRGMSAPLVESLNTSLSKLLEA